MFKKQTKTALIVFANLGFLLSPQLASAATPHKPDLYYLSDGKIMNVWEMTTYLDSSPTHVTKMMHNICFIPTGTSGTHQLYDWYSDFSGWSGKAEQEADQVFMHGDYRKNSGHTSLQWEIVTQSFIKSEHQTKGYGHCVDWQNNQVGSLGETIIFANAKFVRIKSDEKCKHFIQEQIAKSPVIAEQPTDIISMPVTEKTPCGVKNNIIIKDDQLSSK